jgi:hypothetical protein
MQTFSVICFLLILFDNQERHAPRSLLPALRSHTTSNASPYEKKRYLSLMAFLYASMVRS